MSGVRDPAFWKRFSVAVHMDEEQPHSRTGTDSKVDPDSWLARQHRKSSRRTWVCFLFWALFLLLVAGVIIVVIWVLQSGVLERVKIGNGTAAGTPDPNAGADVTPVKGDGGS